MVRSVTNSELGRSEGILSAAYVTNELIFTAGNTGINHQTKEYGSTLEEQTHIAIKNLQDTLEYAGSSLGNVVKVLLFVGDGSYAPIVNKIYAEYFPHKPARSCVVVNFPNKKVKVELEAVAVRSNKAFESKL